MYTHCSISNKHHHQYEASKYQSQSFTSRQWLCNQALSIHAELRKQQSMNEHEPYQVDFFFSTKSNYFLRLFKQLMTKWNILCINTSENSMKFTINESLFQSKISFTKFTVSKAHLQLLLNMILILSFTFSNIKLVASNLPCRK